MTANRSLRFWIAVVLSLGVWVAALLIGGTGSAFDEPLRQSLYAKPDPALARNALLITWLGSAEFLLPIALVATLYLSFRRRRRAALLLLIVFVGRLLVELQKLIIDRARPGADQHLEFVSSTSFPSGHSANSMITYIAIALLVPVKQQNRAIWLCIGLTLALLVGWSRVALGVHWPTDVVGGWAFGTLWIAICMRLASARPDAEAS